jgi:NADH-quinone oxidoreductase subunit N
VLFYLAAYGVSTIGAFAVMNLIRSQDGEEAPGLDQWRGLGQRSPLLAGVFTFFLLSFAGIPLTGGFIAKFAVFSAAMANGGTLVALVGIGCSAITAFFYARVIVAMWFQPSTLPADEQGRALPTLGLTQAAVWLAALVTLVLGVYPTPFLDFARDASQWAPELTQALFLR